MKLAIIIWICEKRPWLLRSPVQVLICATASGLAFAAIENVLYLHVYGLNSVPGLAAWRWTVCVMLHTGCSAIASIGVIRIWQEFQKQSRMPQLSDGAFWFVLAMVIHGTYNFGAVLMDAFDLGF